MDDRELIGIVGGVGPYAGLDLAEKIFDQTRARTDQEHLSVVLLSLPGEIEDRTEFILGRTQINPAVAMVEVIRKLEQMGATVMGIPCNTAHAPQIFDVMLEKLRQAGSKVELVHMIEEVVKFIREKHPRARNVGVLCTTGTYSAKVYPRVLEREGMNVLLPDESLQEEIHAAICDPKYGVKACSNPPTDMAKNKFLDAIAFFRKQGARVIVLGCTEIPIAIKEKEIENTPIIDPTLILARALIKRVAPEKLKLYGEGV
ncbi:MAG: aspartate/glutamate racemase family protein [Candidatus Abyssubacteria bacterium]|nr:aspartate/glutamate racemase family protein [Candidatus Abyssubacteria bacterium]